MPFSNDLLLYLAAKQARIRVTGGSYSGILMIASGRTCFVSCTGVGTDPFQLQRGSGGNRTRLYPTTRWKPGETVKDEFTLYLPPNTPTRAVNLWLGLWDPRTDKRMPLTNPDVVRNDGQHRLMLAQVPVATR